MSFDTYLIGCASFWVYILATIVYILAILKGKVPSNKVTWGIWCVVTAMVWASYYQTVGPVSTLLELVACFVGTVVIFACLCLKGMKGEWTWVEKICVTAVIVTLGSWTLFQPVTLMTLTLTIDIFGAVPLIVSATTEVLDYLGNRRQVETYEVIDKLKNQIPSKDYLSKIINASIKFNFPKSYQDFLKRIPTLD